METNDDLMRRDYNIQVMDNPQYDSSKKVKRYRIAFTTDQVNYLEKEFKKFPYISNNHRKDIALTLNIPERAIKIWFQNRRMKEKKETNKEVDNEPGISTPLELTKDQLCNVSVESTNELRSRSLPLLTDMSSTICDNSMVRNNSMFNIVQDMGTKGSRGNITFPAPQNAMTSTKIFRPPSMYDKSSHLSSHKASAEFSIDLYKKYKSERLSTQSCVESSIDRESIEKNKDQQKSTKCEAQDTPEDLSHSRKKKPEPTQSASASNNSGFVSLVPTVSPFYAQPYISAGGVIWNPVGVMPVLQSNSTALPVPSKPLLNTAQETVTKKDCNCDCHTKPSTSQVPLNFQQQSQSPQYLLTAVPFQNPSTKM